ncbi:MAG TPA: S41 family peptidase [Chitinispirillaceae bacterium]|nr:S41 family peptidase [Chitinispirillaceae bacterium]
MSLHEKKMSVFGRAPIAGVVIMIIIVAGLVVDVTKADSDNFYADIIRLDNVTQKIHQNYVEEMSSKDLIDNAIKGMMRILDPHTTYFEPKQYEELKIHTDGKFGGLGIQISIRDKVLTVMTPITGTPAFRAGIQSGDQILKIEGKSTAGITIDNAVNKLRGEPGTKVTITVRRKGEPKDNDYAITREVIHIKSVPYLGVLDSCIGYIQLSTFSQDAGSEVEKAIKELMKKDIKGVVFDLRHNPGGLLPQAIEVAEKFLARKSLIVSTRGRVRGQNNEYSSGAQPVLPLDIPLVVLVDYASASASEIVSGAVQDWDRGVILGDTTFGKGSVQSILPLDPTHHLKLTTAFYYTPAGRCINRPENAVRGVESEDEMGEEDDGEEIDSSSVKDSSKIAKKPKADTTAYKTKNGRIVYGGGGIVPDTIVQQKMLTLPIRALLVKDAFFQFANFQYPKMKKQKVKVDSSFQVTPALMNDFYAFLDSIKFNYQNFAQMRFTEFKYGTGVTDTLDSAGKKISIYPDTLTLATNELQELKMLASRIDSILTGESKRELLENENEIKSFLREAIITREFGQDHEVYYRLKLSQDNQLKAAINLLLNKDKYASLLKPGTLAEGENKGTK